MCCSKRLDTSAVGRTGLCTVLAPHNKKSDTAASIFNAEWLCRYPRPYKVIYDNGGEFIGQEFQEVLRNFGLDRKSKPTTIKNPQANAIVERIHQVVGNMLRTYKLQDADLDETNIWSEILASIAWAIRSTYHTTLHATPGQLVFGRDMILNIEYIADWELIRRRKQKLINESNRRENSNRVSWTYRPGDYCTIEIADARKLERPREGPYIITNVYSNGTVQVQRGPVSERINIRRLNPFHLPPNSGSEVP